MAKQMSAGWAPPFARTARAPDSHHMLTRATAPRHPNDPTGAPAHRPLGRQAVLAGWTACAVLAGWATLAIRDA